MAGAHLDAAVGSIASGGAGGAVSGRGTRPVGEGGRASVLPWARASVQ